MFDDDSIRFKVVANHQEQYSIWPDFKDIPAGWYAVGPEGLREECLDYIERVWTDMRPKSLRDKMVEKGQSERPDVPDDIREFVREMLAQHKANVDEYAGGKPELYGWFVARAFDARDDLDPDVVRAALDEELPPHNIPEGYA